MSINLNLQLKFLSDALYSSSRFILRDFSEIGQLQSSKKGTADFVHKCYKRIHDRFVKDIAVNSPQIPVIHVDDPIPTHSEYFYVFEPICGTNNFQHNIGFFCNAVALFKTNEHGRAEALATMIHNPMLRENFYAAKNLGAWFENYNETIIPKMRLRVSSQNNIEEAFTVNTSGGNEYFLHNRFLGSHLLEIAYCAAGRFDLIISPIESLLTEASFLLIQEAGGHVETKHDFFLASNDLLYKKAAILFNQISPRPI